MNQALYANVLLPQLLPKALTYFVPVELESLVQIGVRVIVPLGKQRLLAGIVTEIHRKNPEGIDTREIESVLDDEPIVLPAHLDFWSWLARYYACTPGEVMSAALPSGLKLSSETRFEAVGIEMALLNEREQIVHNASKRRRGISLDEISALLGIKSAHNLVRSMLQKGALRSHEEMSTGYKPKLVEELCLTSEYDDQGKLQEAMLQLEQKRARKIVESLQVYLKESGSLRSNGVWMETRLLVSKGASSAALKKLIERGIMQSRNKEMGRVEGDWMGVADLHTLSDEQNRALQEILNSWQQNPVCLLHGVTSSGKTEVYAELMRRTLQEGKQVLLLVPEIALTTQQTRRLKKFFGTRLGVYHSGYSSHERTVIWNKVLSAVPGECDIILGARSSIFLPFTRLGLIIVDEEHDNSYKQQDPAPRYNGRDTAITLSRLFDARVLLGSATPSIESYWNAQRGKYGLVEMLVRHGGVSLPEIALVDIRKELKAKTMQSVFSTELIDAIKTSTDNGRQVIIFQNRRGYAPLWECDACGWVPSCTRCDVSLTYHKQSEELRCHYCGYSTKPVEACHVCGSVVMKMVGHGTQKIEEDLRTILPELIVERMDFDTTRSKASYNRIIAEFQERKTHILVGTQMITKGLDFDNVGLVGILSADRMMSFPDFRSMERSFQTLTQVAGRAGRRGEQGKVIIQTYDPQHWLLGWVQTGDFKSFFAKEIEERRKFAYPPYQRLVQLTLKHKDAQRVDEAAELLRRNLLPMLGERMLGPERPLISRVKNLYLQQFLVRLNKNKEGNEMKENVIHLTRMLMRYQEFSNLRIAIDVDPGS
jgi:primosomal protein N' (replication factor Y)